MQKLGCNHVQEKHNGEDQQPIGYPDGRRAGSGTATLVFGGTILSFPLCLRFPSSLGFISTGGWCGGVEVAEKSLLCLSCPSAGMRWRRPSLLTVRHDAALELYGGCSSRWIKSVGIPDHWSKSQAFIGLLPNTTNIWHCEPLFILSCCSLLLGQLPQTFNLLMIRKKTTPHKTSQSLCWFVSAQVKIEVRQGNKHTSSSSFRKFWGHRWPH